MGLALMVNLKARKLVKSFKLVLNIKGNSGFRTENLFSIKLIAL